MKKLRIIKNRDNFRVVRAMRGAIRLLNDIDWSDFDTSPLGKYILFNSL